MTLSVCKFLWCKYSYQSVAKYWIGKRCVYSCLPVGTSSRIPLIVGHTEVSVRNCKKDGPMSLCWHSKFFFTSCDIALNSIYIYILNNFCFILESEWLPGEGNGNLLQYSCLENPMERGAWWATAQGVSEDWTQLSN